MVPPIFVSAADELKNKTVCEDQELKLHCHESKFLNIYSATYGRRTQQRDICPSQAERPPPFGMCLSTTTVRVLSYGALAPQGRDPRSCRCLEEMGSHGQAGRTHHAGPASASCSRPISCSITAPRVMVEHLLCAWPCSGHRGAVSDRHRVAMELTFPSGRGGKKTDAK